MLYGISGQPWIEATDENGEAIPPPWLPRRSNWVMAICLPVWVGIVYGVAHLWTTYIDAFCARLTQRLENHVFEKVEKCPGPLV